MVIIENEIVIIMQILVAFLAGNFFFRIIFYAFQILVFLVSN